jgi:uncharacterized SAM-binding protein YcdF (DUF218 family)
MKRFLRFGRFVLLGLVVWLFACGILAAIIHQTGSMDEASESDVIIVLGAGLTRDGRPNRALNRRSEHAAELWKAGYADTIICTGGVGLNQTRSEADACREVLLREGVQESAIVLEDTSRSTEENALNSQAIMEANGWQTAILVSDSYHVFRARYIFSSVGIAIVLSPVPFEEIPNRGSYVYSMVRELFALHWQIFKETFHIPVTYLPLG